METQALDAVSATVKTGTGKVLVEKRDGRVVDFDPINIISAVKSAFADLDKKIGPQEEQLIRDIANQVEAEIKDRYNGPAKIEDIQNLVEHGLIEDHLYDVARTYTNYRLNKDIERAKATDINEAVKRLVNRDEALVRENANKDSNVYSTQRTLEILDQLLLMLGREEQAERVFSAQETAVQPILSQEPTGKSCAFFSLTTNNLATVRKGSDYVARMIEMAGGSYVFADLTDNGNSLATMNLPLEDFYAGAKDADVLIYNSAIEGMIASVSQLTERFPLLNEFKAVQNGQVWCTTQSLFQQSMELADLIVDMNRVFTEGTPAAGTLKFLTHVD